jgi:hypothetical protein
MNTDKHGYAGWQTSWYCLTAIATLTFSVLTLSVLSLSTGEHSWYCLAAIRERIYKFLYGVKPVRRLMYR